MKQVVLREPGKFVAEQATPPVPGEQDALVRVHRIGVCGTDLHAFEGKQPFFAYPRILGHELGVEVLSAPPNEKGIQSGDRCAVEPYLSCGHCRACQLDRPNCCASLSVLGVHTDGGMRPFLTVPVQLLHKSEQLSLDQLALVETLGIGAHAVKRSGLREGESALVVGAGPIGLAVVQFAQITGADVKVLELSAERRAFVEQFGVEAISHPEAKKLDVVFDATGNTTAMEASFDFIDQGGRLVLVGLVQGRISFDDPQFHRRELNVLSSRNSCRQFPRLIQMIETGQIDTNPWITDRLGLSDVPTRFVDLRTRANLVKAMIQVDSGDE